MSKHRPGHKSAPQVREHNSRAQWCEPPCILPNQHGRDCWDGTHCGTCPIGCHYCDGSEACPCIEDHTEDDV